MRQRRRSLRMREYREWMPPLDTPHEYAEEARQEKPLLRLYGLHDSALLNRKIVRRRYQRHREFFANGDWKWRVGLPVGMALLWAVITAALYFYTVYDIESRASLRPRDPIVETSIGAIVSSAFSVLMGAALSQWHQWRLTYAQVYVFEQSDTVDYWRTTGCLLVPLPRLAFVDRADDGDFFSGPTRRSGVQYGIIHLDLPVGRAITSIRSIDELYALSPSHSTFTDVPARQTYGMLMSAVEAGERLQRLGKNKALQTLTENAPWLVVGACLVVIFLTLSAE